MKFFTPFIIAFSLFVSGCNAEPGLKDTDGHVYNYKSLQGKWVILNYWAGWCDSCQVEIPELNRFNNRLQKKKIVLLGVNFDGLPPAELAKLSQKLKIQFPQLTTNPADHYGIDDIPGLPLTFVINPEGKIVRRLMGAQTEASLTKLVKELG